MSYAPSLAANAVMLRAKEQGRSLDHMQVQKLVFFLHAWSLALRGQSVIAEKPEAWPYGPVFSSLYHRLKGHGARRIDKLLEDYHSATGQMVPLIPNPADAEFWGMVDQVMNTYGKFSGVQLSDLTHEPGGPWAQTREAKQAYIDDEAIKAHYSKQLQHGSAAG